METILVCDDDPKIVEIIQAYLVKEGYRVVTAYNGAECLEKASQPGNSINLIILDVMMPKMDGFQTCKAIRAVNDVPIIFLTARVEEADKVFGLELGGDDYVVKPFSPRELVARVKANLRRYQSEDSQAVVYRFEELTINPEERRVQVGGVEVPLTTKEFDLLLSMARHPGRVYTRELLYELVWGDNSFGDVRTVDVHVTRLRNKLEQRGGFRYIHTVWGVGYRFEVAPK
jgi:two-component system response regulator ResD